MSTSRVKFFFWCYLLFLVWAEATVTNPTDPDLWHRLALGETLLQTGHFPLGDYFSYLADYQEIADHEWGSAIIFYALYQWGGGSAIVAMKIITLAITLSLIVWAGLWQRRPTVLTAAFYSLVLLALLPSFQSTVRCMTFTHIFFALWLYWFQCERHGRSIPTFFYVLTVILWANLHGGFVIGLGWLLAITLLGLFVEEPSSSAPVSRYLSLKFPGLFSDKATSALFRSRLTLPETHFWSTRKWFARFFLCSLATLINPFGWHLWISTGRALLATRRGFQEWGPVSWWTDFGAYPGYKLLLIGVVVALAVLIYRRGWKRIDRPILILIGAFMVLSLFSARHTSLFAVIVGVLLPGLFPRTPPPKAIADPIHRMGYVAARALLLMLPLLSALIVLPGEGLHLSYPHIACPVEAVDYLQHQNIRGRLLVPFNYGSYALWQLRDRMRVSMDGRYDLVYRPETFQRVEDFFAAKGDWSSLLTTPAPDAVLVRRSDNVYLKLKNLPAWTEAWRDDTDAVFLPLAK